MQFTSFSEFIHPWDFMRHAHSIPPPGQVRHRVFVYLAVRNGAQIVAVSRNPARHAAIRERRIVGALVCAPERTVSARALAVQWRAACPGGNVEEHIAWAAHAAAQKRTRGVYLQISPSYAEKVGL